jgi:hypothetical protein
MESLNELGLELSVQYESIIDALVTPFDTICKICLFDNKAPIDVS